MKYLRYLRYIILHKWFVFMAGLKTKAPFWNLLIHDHSKFRADEFLAYTDWFYDKPLQERETHKAFATFGVVEAAPFGYFAKDRFNKAWLLHCHRNPHHWNFWVFTDEAGNSWPLPMPDELIREMVADWMGASRAINGKWAAKAWYLNNRDKIKLHPDTKFVVEVLLNVKE